MVDLPLPVAPTTASVLPPGARRGWTRGSRRSGPTACSGAFRSAWPGVPNLIGRCARVHKHYGMVLYGMVLYGMVLYGMVQEALERVATLTASERVFQLHTRLTRHAEGDSLEHRRRRGPAVPEHHVVKVHTRLRHHQLPTTWQVLYVQG